MAGRISLLDYGGGDDSEEDLRRWRRFGGKFKKVETFGEKKLRHTQGLVPGIGVAVHLEDVLKQDIEDPCIVIVMVMCSTTLDFSNVLFYRLALRLISGMSRGCSSG